MHLEALLAVLFADVAQPLVPCMASGTACKASGFQSCLEKGQRLQFGVPTLVRGAQVMKRRAWKVRFSDASIKKNWLMKQLSAHAF